jgi:hypothetical protein
MSSAPGFEILVQHCLEAKEVADRHHLPFEGHLKTNKDQLRLLQKMADDIQLECTITAAMKLAALDFARAPASRVQSPARKSRLTYL